MILEASSASYGKATAWLPIIDLLRSYFQIEARDDTRKIHEKVTGKVLSLDRALEVSLPVFFWLLDVPAGDPQWALLDPTHRRQHTLDAVKRLLLRESQVQPLVVLFEDLLIVTMDGWTSNTWSVSISRRGKPSGKQIARWPGTTKTCPGRWPETAIYARRTARP